MSELFEYKCPNCGGALRFDSSVQQLKCPYCDSTIDVAALAGYDEELKNAQPDNMNWEETAGSQWEAGETDNMRVYVCNSCGGQIMADENTAASRCPYCDNPVVMKGNLSGVLKPDFIIPFKINKEQAKAAYHNHLKGKKFLPKVFEDKNHIDEIKALYVPFWLFDCDVDADMKYRGIRTRAWADSENSYMETSYYAILRSGTLAFDNVPVDGSSVMSDDLMQSIEPFDFSEAKRFSTAYLPGYLADKYDIGAEASIGIANNRIRKSTEQAFMSTIGSYSSVSPEASSIRLINGRAKYALYPVWVLNTTYEGQRYIFALNGQTGKTVGDLPVSKSAYWKNFGLVGAITAAAVFGLQLLAYFYM